MVLCNKTIDSSNSNLGATFICCCKICCCKTGCDELAEVGTMGETRLNEDLVGVEVREVLGEAGVPALGTGV